MSDGFSIRLYILLQHRSRQFSCDFIGENMPQYVFAPLALACSNFAPIFTPFSREPINSIPLACAECFLHFYRNIDASTSAAGVPCFLT